MGLKLKIIINPSSGRETARVNIEDMLAYLASQKKLERADIYYTAARYDATNYAKNTNVDEYDYLIAVGGDGTVNEVARGLRDTQTALGIIPMGSGNGFARHLNVPMRVNKAIEMLNHSEPIAVDYGLANDHLFVTTCGTGFDAMIAEQFAAAGKRGFATYIQKIVSDLVSYKPQHYRIVSNDDSKLNIDTTSFLITFANANQWGNEAYIAPHASIQDGKMDICIMSGKAIFAAPSLALGLFTKMIDKSLFMDGAQAKEITLYRDEKAPFHIDGDPVEMEKDIHIRIVEDGLKVLVEKRF